MKSVASQMNSGMTFVNDIEGTDAELPSGGSARPSASGLRSASAVAWSRLLSFLLFGLLALPMSLSATEEPDFQVVRHGTDMELREYGAYTVAEVVVPGPADQAGSQAFPILAGYIFGKNKGERKLAMTAPVTQVAEPVKMAMTAPVTQAAAAGGFRVQFVLPKGVNAANAPEPLDPRVQLRDVPPRRVAVIRYSGFWSASNDQEHLDKLRAALRAADLVTEGEPVLARYNPPFTPWFLRRNEIWLRLAGSP